MAIIEFNPKRQTLNCAVRMAIMHAKARRSVVRFEHEGVDILVTGDVVQFEVERMFHWARSTGNCSIGPTYIWTPEKQDEYQAIERTKHEKWKRDARLRENSDWLLDQVKHLYHELANAEDIDDDDIKELRAWLKDVVAYASGDIIE